MRDQFDVVVIGSGAGGAPIAYELLAQAGACSSSRRVRCCARRTSCDGRLSDFKRDEMFNAGPEKNHHRPRHDQYGRLVLHEPRRARSERRAARLRDLDGNGPKVTIEGYTAQVVGGGTQLYGAVSLRFAPTRLSPAELQREPQRALQERSEQRCPLRHVRDWPFDYATLEPYYAKAERLVGINGTRARQAKPFSSG